ncbi:hypothetical protein B0H66DRAFT_553202 [Apodospora peruviana]|uniref:Uncharacterized protein n=1 Tax=Apodospora peruviana TaxID=516989 RepID=A0AAE0IBF1_9PEZI|nr:hypothetical protein B0H66DRAFT_553202 [Apodospora peruviana]
MVLKRRRSDSEHSFSSAFSSPQRPGSSNFDFRASCAVVSPTSRGLFSPSSRGSTPSHLPSRTMKRYRNNRPSDAQVHEHTMGLLYSAQQQHTQDQTQPLQAVSAGAPIVAENHNQTCPITHQRSLHSFWNLPSSASGSSQASEAAPSPPIMRPDAPASSSCEDCGVGLGDGDDTMMDDGFMPGEDHSCGACGKAVCFSCSVSNLGEHRRCLACAGRMVCVGGTG